MQKTISFKLIAIVLLLALVVPIFGNTAYAVSEEIAVNQENLRTSTRLVDANLAFVRGDEALENISADVSQKDLKFRLFLNLKDEGYLQGGQIEIRDSENLTYEFVKPEKKSELIQSVESQVIKLNQIKGESETYLEVPIRYVGVDNVDSKTLLNKNDFEFKGEYTNVQGRKYDVYKRTTLSLNWVDNKEVEISNKVQKFIKYEIGQSKGVVLQNLITVHNKKKETMLPTQKVSIETNLLKLEDKLPKSVSVSVQKAALFNDDENIVLDKDIYKWQADKNLLTIEVENAKNKDDTYSVGNGNLEILVTSLYDIENLTNKYEGSMDINVRQFVLSGDSKLSEVQKELKTQLVFDKEIGKIVDVNETLDVTEINKGILYVNSRAKEVKDTVVKSKLKLDVSNVEIVDSIKVVENEPQYNNGISENNFIYKSLEINKNEFDHVFAEGYLDIYSGKKLLGRIDNKSLEVNKKYVFNFKDKVSNLRIETSKPSHEGEVFLEFSRVLGKASQSIDTLKGVSSLKLDKQAYIVLNNEQKLLNNISHSIKLVNASSNVSVSVNKTELSTIKKNENVEFVIALNNDKLNSDIYGQTVIEMLLPKGINDLKIKNTNLIHGDGLKIASTTPVKIGSQYAIQIVLTGVQDGLSTGHLTNGTNIVLNTDITLDQWITSQDVKYGVTYSNIFVTNYSRNVQWNMSPVFANFQKYGNGFVQGQLQYVAPKGLVLINELDKFNNKKDNVISINQGYKEGKLDVLAGPRLVDGNVYLLNNSGSEVSNPTILGRVPNKTNRDIFTNELLGSTFDTTLNKKVSSSENIRVYYSTNANATNDLRNVNNAWSETLPLKDAKSYLVVLGSSLSKDKLVKLNYGLLVPGNLEHNQQVLTYSMVEYGVKTTKGTVRYYQMASPLGLSTGEGVQLNIDLKADKSKVTEHENIVYTLEVKNEATKTAAKNVESYFEIPQNLEFKGIRDDATKTPMRLSQDQKGVYITLGDINVGTTATKELVFTAKKVKNEEPIELKVNTAADNFAAVKSEKSVGNTVEGTKLSVVMKDLGFQPDPTVINFYPKQTKYYEITVRNNTGFSYNEEKKTATYGDALGKVNLSIPLPSTLEYVGEGDSIYKVIEYNRVTNTLKIQLLDDQLAQDSTVVFQLPLRLKDTMPASFDKTIKLVANATTKTLGTNQDVAVQSNVITNYVAEKKLNATTAIYNFEDFSGKPLTDVQEFQDVYIKYSITPTYTIVNSDLIFEVPEGVSVRSIYKKTTHGNHKSSAIASDGIKTNNGTILHKYPFYVPANKTLDIFIHATIEGIGEATSKTLSYKVGMEGALQTVNLTVRKGAVQNVMKEMYEKEGLSLSPEDMKKYGLGAGGDTVAKNSVLGKTWVDSNQTGVQTVNDIPLGKVTVELIDNETKKVVARTVSDDNGNYQFDNIVNGNYSVVFKYNDNRYTPTAYNVQSLTEDNSKGIRVTLQDSGNTSVAVTDGIQVNFASVKNVDLGLVEKSNFDLRLDGEIIEIEVQNPKKDIKKYNFNDRKTVKLELDRNNLNASKVLTKYLVRVVNEGELEGTVSRLNAYIPEGMKFVPDLNKAWEIDEDGNVFTTSLSAQELKVGETKALTLILEKEFAKEGLGLSVLGLEIAEAKNNLGVVDRDSTPNNKNTEEDDYINLELVLGLNTGKKVAYTLLILTTVVVIGTMIFLVLRKISGKEIK